MANESDVQMSSKSTASQQQQMRSNPVRSNASMDERRLTTLQSSHQQSKSMLSPPRSIIFTNVQDYLHQRKTNQLDDDSIVDFRLKADPSFIEKCCLRRGCELSLLHGKCFTTGTSSSSRDEEADANGKHRRVDSKADNSNDINNDNRRGCDICETLAFLDLHRDLWSNVDFYSVTDKIVRDHRNGIKVRYFQIKIEGLHIMVAGTANDQDEIEALHVIGRLGAALCWRLWGSAKFRNRELAWSNRA